MKWLGRILAHFVFSSHPRTVAERESRLARLRQRHHDERASVINAQCKEIARLSLALDHTNTLQAKLIAEAAGVLRCN